MQRVERRSVESDGMVGRRTWLIGAAMACAGAGGWARGEEPAPATGDAQADEDRERSTVEALGERKGLRPFRSSRTANFQGIGDAADDYRAMALRDCEAVTADYLDHYRAKGFDVAPPARRLTVVTLADDRSFAAYLGDGKYVLKASRLPTASVRGMYMRETNRLVVFDHRSLGPGLVARGGLENLRVVAHEATHQLTFNTGLLERRGDVPTCILEGLAMYGEVRRSSGRTPPGEVNLMRLEEIAHSQRRRPWIAVATLLTDDRVVRLSGTDPAGLLGYAESWLLLHYLMNEPVARIGFRRYLKAIRERETPDHRLEDASTHLGDLDRLNQQVHEYSLALLKERR